MNLKDDCSKKWEGGQGDASVYLQSVDATLKLTESLNRLLWDEDSQVQNESRLALQMAMTRLEEVFCHILLQNKHLLLPQFVSFRSCEDQFVSWDSFSTCYYSCDDYSVSEDSLSRLPSVSSLEGCQETSRSFSSQDLEEYVVDLLSPSSVLNLKHITQVMSLSGYDHQCHQAYIGIRKNVLLEFLLKLGIKKMSIEEVSMMDWRNLNQKIKQWTQAVKKFVRVLFCEKLLCEQIFEDRGSASTICFIETSKDAMLQLVNFAGTIAVGPHLPEKLFSMVDMYKRLCSLLPDVEALFIEKAGYCVRTECHEVFKRVGDFIKGILAEFEYAVRTNTSSVPHSNGCIHPFTIYVMNYIEALIDYSGTLNVLLEVSFEDQISLSSNSKHNIEQDEEWGFSHYVTQLSGCLGSIISSLEFNLKGKSKLYRDRALQYFFLLNNIYYVVQKVESSALKTLLGGDWIRKHDRKIQQHALSFERASWNLILSFLKYEGISSPRSDSATASKVLLKERWKSFNVAFEEIYKTQTAWLIADLQLREDLRLSISVNVLQAYRSFWRRNASKLEGSWNSGKYVKYTPEDLEHYLLEFFEGTPRSLSNQRKS